MFETIQYLRETFWHEYIWTPPNTDWATYEKYRRFDDLYYSVYTAIMVLIIRFIVERSIFIPLGIRMGLAPNRVRPPPPNNLLEKSYGRTRGKLSDKELLSLCKQLDCQERKIQRWMRLRLAQDRPTVLSKFTESAWRCTSYTILFIYGLTVLWDKPWMWDSIYCFIGYPHLSVSSSEWWYYNIETAFYLSLLFSQFFDVQRKDFWVMFIHHVVTLCLLTFSWACNLIRVGTLVLVIHDFADIPLEGAKMMAYLKKQRTADCIFNFFAVSWVISRIGLLPYRIIYYSSYITLQLFPMFAAYYIFNSLLFILQALHIIWTYLIIRVAIQAWNNNGIKDIRSDDEEEINEEDEKDYSELVFELSKSKNNKTLEEDSKVHINGDAARYRLVVEKTHNNKQLNGFKNS